MATSPSPARASAPFDTYDSADVILRSSDQYDFHVHKIVLSLASPFFKQMFSLSQPIITPSSTPSPPENAEPLPVIPVTEDRDTIDYLLRLCYPIADPPTPEDVGTVAQILEAALKYELEEATEILKRQLCGFVPTVPLKVYAYACRLRLENEARKAAIQWRDHTRKTNGPDVAPCYTTPHSANSSTPRTCSDLNCIYRSFDKTLLGSAWVGEMKEITAGCLYRLLCFVRAGETISFCDPPPPPIPDSPSGFSTTPSSAGQELLDLCPSDIVLRSSDMKLIHTYRPFLALAGASELLKSSLENVGTSGFGDLPIFDVDADEATTLNLLKVCQPLAVVSDISKKFTPAELYKLMAMVDRYGMTRVMGAIRSNQRNRIEDTPLGVYFTAMKYDWTEEAREAAEQTTNSPLFDQGGYTPEMEHVSAYALHTLYRFHHRYRRAGFTASEILRNDSAPQTDGVDLGTTTLPLALVPLIKGHHQPHCGYTSYCCITQGRFMNEEGRLVERSIAALKKVKVASQKIKLLPT